MSADGETNDIIKTSICTKNDITTMPNSVVKLVEKTSHTKAQLKRQDVNNHD